jgi:hypothetical protein
MTDHSAVTASKENWFVAVKVLLRNGDDLLVLKDTFGDGDIPGGRLRKDDFTTPLLEVLKRKISEEIGDQIQYEINPDPVVLFRHERFEVGSGETRRIFAVGYEANYLGGEITLGDYLESYTWVNIHTVNLSEYLEGGWLTGVEEYLTKVRS